MNKSKTRLFALDSAQKLGKKISQKLKLPLTKIEKTTFADGEVILQADETVRNKHVFVVASISNPVNDNLMELLLFLDSLKRASAKTITTVISYYGYARQDRKASGRQPIGAKLVADLIMKAGATKIITVDLHNPSIQGFFDLSVDDLKAQYVIADHIKKTGKFTIVSPDHGGTTRARLLAELVSPAVQIAIVDKRRTGPNESETMGILGNVKGKNIVIVDDMIDTGGTIIKAAKALKDQGAKKILVAATHGLFSKGFDLFDKAEHIDQVVVTDSIGKVYDIKSKKLKVITLADVLAHSIEATADGKSISIFYEQVRKKHAKK